MILSDDGDGDDGGGNGNGGDGGYGGDGTASTASTLKRWWPGQDSRGSSSSFAGFETTTTTEAGSRRERLSFNLWMATKQQHSARSSGHSCFCCCKGARHG